METLLRELRFAERSLRRDPTFSIAAVLTLALGIGAVTAVFSVLHGVLLAPLPFPDGDRLVRLHSTNSRGEATGGQMSPSDMWDMREAKSLAAAAPIYPYEGTLEDAEGNMVRVPGYVVSADFFEIFRVQMVVGRGFLLEEDAPNSGIEAVLSHALWRTALGGDPSIVGRTVSVEGGPVTVVGVAPPEMRYPRDAALWLLPGFNWANMARRGRSWDVVARLEPTASVASTQAELTIVADRLAQEHPQWNTGVGVSVVPLKESIVGDLRVALLILMAAAAGLLLVASANVANLMIARGAARLQETALRSALGASRWRIIGTLFAEAAVTAVGGAVLGVLLALLALAAFRRLAPPEVSLLGDATFGWQGLAFAGAVTVTATLLLGVLPALRASSTDLRTLLGDGGRRSTSGASGTVLRSALVVAEVAVATTLVIGSGLLIRSYQNVSRQDPGFSARQALTFNLVPQIGLYGGYDDLSGLYEELMRELDAIPGVVNATMTTTIPLGTEYDVLRPIRLMDLPEPEIPEEMQARYRPVWHDFFDAMGIDLVEGRTFTDLDIRHAAPVAVVNEAFVRRHVPDGRALNRRLRMSSSNWSPIGRLWSPEADIVGVVRDVRYVGLAEAAQPAIYFPYMQAPFRRMSIVIITSGEPEGIVTAVRERVAQVDARIAVSGLSTLDGIVRASTVSQRFTTTLLLVFGLVALAMAMVGIHGVVSYQVTERVREMAVRLSIGATPGEVVRLILVSGARAWGLGIGVGFAGAILLRRVLASQLFGVSATDPVTFVGAGAVLGLVAVLATLVPALRATRLEPAKILREA